MKTLAIVGSSRAGLSAARTARAEGFDGKLVLVSDDPHRPYDRPPLSKDFLSGKIAPDVLQLEDDGEDLAVDWLLAQHAVAVDAGERAAVLDDGARLTADGVVLATGSTARMLPVFDEFDNVHTLARAVLALLGAPGPRPQAALRTSGPTSTASASSSVATPSWPTGSRSRQATPRATASWPSTNAGTTRWGCSAAPRRGSSPSGAATSSAPCAPTARRHTAPLN